MKDFIKQMNAAPNNEPPKHPQTDSNKKHPESRTLAVILDWLRHYWDTPRQQSKWTEIATVGLTLAIAIAAFWSAWIFNGQLTVAQKAIEDAAADARSSRRHVRRQLAIAQMQATAAQESVKSLSQQIGVMKKQLEVTDRPWITVDATANTEWVPRAFVGGPLTFDKDGNGRFTVKVSMKNIGRSVATHVYLRTATVALGLLYSDDILLVKQRKLCNGPNPYAKSKVPLRFDTRLTIFPNDSEVVFAIEGFETKEVPEPPPSLKLASKPIQPFVIGCIDYDYPSSSNTHQTGFIYEVYGSKSHQGIQAMVDIPVDQLTFERYSLGGSYAY